MNSSKIKFIWLEKLPDFNKTKFWMYRLIDIFIRLHIHAFKWYWNPRLVKNLGENWLMTTKNLRRRKIRIFYPAKPNLNQVLTKFKLIFSIDNHLTRRSRWWNFTQDHQFFFELDPAGKMAGIRINYRFIGIHVQSQNIFFSQFSHNFHNYSAV